MSILGRLKSYIQELKITFLDTEEICKHLNGPYAWRARNKHTTELMLGALKRRGMLEIKGGSFFACAASYSSVHMMKTLAELGLDCKPKRLEPYNYSLLSAVASFNGPVVLWLLSQEYSNDFLTGGHNVFLGLSARNSFSRWKPLLEGFEDEDFGFHPTCESNKILKKVVQSLCDRGFSPWDRGCGEFCCRSVMVECAENLDFELMEILLDFDDQLFFQFDDGLNKSIIDSVIGSILMGGGTINDLYKFDKIMQKYNFSFDVLDERLDSRCVTKAWSLARAALGKDHKIRMVEGGGDEPFDESEFERRISEGFIWMAEELINLGADAKFRAHGMSVEELISEYDQKHGEVLPHHKFFNLVAVDHPHAIYQSRDSGIEWRVLKTYKRPSSERRDAYAKWVVGARALAASELFDIGDANRVEILHYGRMVAATKEWQEAYNTEPAPTVREFLGGLMDALL